MQTTSNMLIMRDSVTASREAAERFACAAVSAVAKRSVFFAAIPGGSSPVGMFDFLASPDFADIVPWSAVHIFFTDERCVPPDSEESNYRQAMERLLSRVPIPESNIHRFLGEISPDEAAVRYEEEMRSVMGADPGFDLIVLGMGADTHTASLFPGTAAIEEQDRLAVANHVENLKADRLTLTLLVLNSAEQVIVLAFGSDKAEALRTALHGEYDPVSHPIQAVKPFSGRLLWIVDQEAAVLVVRS